MEECADQGQDAERTGDTPHDPRWDRDARVRGTLTGRVVPAPSVRASVLVWATSVFPRRETSAAHVASRTAWRRTALAESGVDQPRTEADLRRDGANAGHGGRSLFADDPSGEALAASVNRLALVLRRAALLSLAGRDGTAVH